MSEPVFVVVGHPNKGKSSLVATLSRDTSVRISEEPGTTTRARSYPMRVDGQTLYALVDTPGFQRARAALAWMKRRESDAASRPKVVAEFVAEHRDEMFRDERELLAPIIDPDRPAGIIYVVDGASPYGPEYDAEMEILRWTGRPSMAIINPIGAAGEAQYVKQWEDALGQFFRVVRVLDVMQAPFDQQIELLRAFGQLSDDWRQPLERAAEALVADRQRKRADAARVIADLIEDVLTHREVKDIGKTDDPRPHLQPLEEKYRGRLRQMERKARQEVEAVYGHDGLDRRESDVQVLEADLLARETWLAFGLKKRDLIAVGAVGGAVVGGMADAALLGSSFLAGTVIGAAAGGALGYFGSNKLAEVKVFRQPLGGQRLRCGPTKNPNFPFVVLGRARHHHALVAGRTHARRDALLISDDPEQVGQMNPLSQGRQRRLAGLFERLRKSDPGGERRARAMEQLTDEVEQLLGAGPSVG